VTITATGEESEGDDAGDRRGEERKGDNSCDGRGEGGDKRVFLSPKSGQVADRERNLCCWGVFCKVAVVGVFHDNFCKKSHNNLCTETTL